MVVARQDEAKTQIDIAKSMVASHSLQLWVGRFGDSKHLSDTLEEEVCILGETLKYT